MQIWLCKFYNLHICTSDENPMSLHLVGTKFKSLGWVATDMRYKYFCRDIPIL